MLSGRTPSSDRNRVVPGLHEVTGSISWYVVTCYSRYGHVRGGTRVVPGGEPLTPEILDWADEELAGVAVSELYGQTEANLLVTNCRAWFPAQAGSMGKPVPGHEVAIVDQETGERLGTDEVGMTAVRHGEDPSSSKSAGTNPRGRRRHASKPPTVGPTGIARRIWATTTPGGISGSRRATTTSSSRRATGSDPEKSGASSSNTPPRQRERFSDENCGATLVKQAPKLLRVHAGTFNQVWLVFPGIDSPA